MECRGDCYWVRPKDCAPAARETRPEAAAAPAAASNARLVMVISTVSPVAANSAFFLFAGVLEMPTSSV